MYETSMSKYLCVGSTSCITDCKHDPATGCMQEPFKKLKAFSSCTRVFSRITESSLKKIPDVLFYGLVMHLRHGLLPPCCHGCPAAGTCSGRCSHGCAEDCVICRATRHQMFLEADIISIHLYSMHMHMYIAYTIVTTIDILYSQNISVFLCLASQNDLRSIPIASRPQKPNK